MISFRVIDRRNSRDQACFLCLLISCFNLELFFLSTSKGTHVFAGSLVVGLSPRPFLFSPVLRGRGPAGIGFIFTRHATTCYLVKSCFWLCYTRVCILLHSHIDVHVNMLHLCMCR